MLQSIQHRYGQTIRATDGEIGHVKDFYFDDENWTVRYLVADTGGWLTGRLVLISPHAFGHLYPEGEVLLVNLTRQQIEDSPSIDEHMPVSREHEEQYHQHYGYDYYAESMPMWGLTGYPVIIPAQTEAVAKQGAADAHLRSVRELNGYSVEANDGTVGTISDFLIDGRTWTIRDLIVECGHWYAGDKVAVPTEMIARINHELCTLHVDSTKHAFSSASERHQAHAA